MTSAASERVHNGRVRRLRLTVLLAASAALVLGGCTDPSPETSPTASDTPTATAPSEDSTTDASTEATTEAESEPFFGVPNNPSGGSSVCPMVDGSIQATLSTVLTATSPITLESVTLEPESPDVEMLDQFVLPYDGGLGGLTFGDYPPDDRNGQRSDAAGYQLDAGETITIGVGFEIAEDPTPTTMTLGITYMFAGSGDTEDLESVNTLVLDEDCDPNT